MSRYDDSSASVSICCDKGLCSPHHFSTGKVRRKPFELIARKPGNAGIFVPHVILHGVLNLPVRVDAEHSTPGSQLFHDARRAMVPAAIDSGKGVITSPQRIGEK